MSDPKNHGIFDRKFSKSAIMQYLKEEENSCERKIQFNFSLYYFGAENMRDFCISKVRRGQGTTEQCEWDFDAKIKELVEWRDTQLSLCKSSYKDLISILYPKIPRPISKKGGRTSCPSSKKLSQK